MDNKHFTPPGAASDRLELDRYLSEKLASYWQYGFSKGYLLLRLPSNMYAISAPLFLLSPFFIPI
jgi:hypothetical protein